MTESNETPRPAAPAFGWEKESRRRYVATGDLTGRATLTKADDRAPWVLTLDGVEFRLGGRAGFDAAEAVIVRELKPTAEIVDVPATDAEKAAARRDRDRGFSPIVNVLLFGEDDR